MSSITLSEALRGCTAGRIQSVGFMQVIPLISDMVDDRFMVPSEIEVSTNNYGTLVFKNPTDNPVIIPAQAAYIVKQSAQDHAMTGAGVVASKKTKTYKNAACIEQSQGGYISNGQHEIRVLPVPIRRKAVEVRREQSYSKLWPAIAEFNRMAGIREGSSHLEYFTRHYSKQLDEFVAEFEPVENQVGAIVMIGGVVAGVERAPNHAYWLDLWQALIRDCYGALAIIEAKNGEAPVPKTRAKMRQDIRSLDDLSDALDEVEESEREKVGEVVNRISQIDIKLSQDEKSGDIRIDSADNRDSFVGQVVREGEKVLYTSLVATETWQKHADWFQANSFKM